MFFYSIGQVIPPADGNPGAERKAAKPGTTVPIEATN